MILKESNSKEPLVLFFDLGKVLVDYDFGLAFNRIEEGSTLPSDEFKTRIPEIENLNTIYEAGKITTAGFFQRMAEVLQFKGTVNTLEKIWINIFKPITENIEMVRLVSEAHPLAIISNTSEAHIRFLEANYSFFDSFRARIYSHMIGFRKPDSRIYDYSRNIMNAKARKSLFIDDRIENISAAASLGWMTIHLQGMVGLQQALLEAGVEV